MMQNFTFAHLADVHLGAWHAHPELRSLSLKSFEYAVSSIIQQRCSFAIISGDFFDTSMPGIEVVRFGVEQLARLRDAGILVYVIAGSHDYSPTGKTMLSVLEAAGLLTNVHEKMTVDEKTGTQLIGIEGLAGGLDRHSFERIEIRETGKSCFRIFMLHASIQEFAIPMMRDASVPMKIIPKGFDYYANGHVHERRIEKYDNAPLVFPGPTFPCDFSELENLSHGSFCVISVKGGKPSVHTVHINLAETELVEVSAENKAPGEIEKEIEYKIIKTNLKSKILLLKSRGTLSSGRPSDISWKRLAGLASSNGALAIKSSIRIEAKEPDEEAQFTGSTIREVEEKIIDGHSGKSGMQKESEKKTISQLMSSLAIEKTEEESRSAFDERIKSEVKKIFGIQ